MGGGAEGVSRAAAGRSKAGRVSITALHEGRTPRQQPKEDRHSRETAGIQVFSSSVVPQGLLGVRHLVDSERPAVCSLLDLKTSLGAERMLVADSSMGSSEKFPDGRLWDFFPPSKL